MANQINQILSQNAYVSKNQGRVLGDLAKIIKFKPGVVKTAEAIEKKI